MLVDMQRLAALINEHVTSTPGGLEKIYCLYRLVSGEVTRNRFDKYYLPVAEYAPTSYKRSCLGGMYMMSRRVAGRMFQRALREPRAMRLDDLWVTGVLREKEGFADAAVVETELRGDGPLARHCNRRNNAVRMWKRDLSRLAAATRGGGGGSYCMCELGDGVDLEKSDTEFRKVNVVS